MKSYVELIVLFQKGTVNDAEDVAPVIQPVIFRKPACKVSQLLHQVSLRRYPVPLLDHIHYPPCIVRLHHPKVRAAGLLPFPGIGYIKYIAKPRAVPGIIHQGNSPGAALYIPSHTLIPQVILCTRRRIRTLGIDHQLFMIGIFIKARCRSKKCRPFLPAFCNLDRCLVGHLCIHFCFACHNSPPFLAKEMTARWPPFGFFLF